MTLSPVGVLLAVASAPLTAAVLGLSRLVDGPGPLVHDQRVGLGGAPLTVPKVRTTFEGTVEGVPTRLGWWIRLACLDELPQLWLVASGRMALVGPRPLRVAELDSWDVDELAVMLSHRPGLIGRWVILTGHGHDHRFRDCRRVETDWLSSRTRAGDALLLLSAPLGLARALRVALLPQWSGSKPGGR